MTQPLPAAGSGRYDVLAHGIGGARDLPIPTELTIAGAVAALVVSFTVLIVAWREPRYDTDTHGRPAPALLAALVDSRVFSVGARAVGMVLFLYTAWVAVLGEDLLTNPFFGIVYVLLWVGIVPASLLLGPVWRAISPVRTINLAFARLTGGEAGQGLLRYPSRLGYWPAAVGLLLFVWLELVYINRTDLGPVRLWFAAYVAVMLVGGALWGDRFYERADPFEVYSTLVGKLSIWGRRGGALVVRSPLANLATVEVAPGLVGVVAVLFGSTAYDSFSSSEFWLRTMNQHLEWAYVANNLALLGFCVGVGVILAAGAMLTGVRPGQSRWVLPDLYAHSVVPIIVGYIVAHYLSYLIEVGQQTLILMSDPMSDGSDLLGTGDWSVNYWLSYHPTFLATTKVLAVVVGHVLGVVAAHDRALTLLPQRHQVTGQLPLLVAMVAFTVGGLYLLFAA